MKCCKNKRLYLLLTSCVPLLGSFPALAQLTQPSVDPARIEKRFEDRTPAAASPTLQNLVPSTESPASAAVQQRLAKQRFVLKGVDISQNTVFSDEDLAFAYNDLIGKEISLVDAQSVVSRINDHYRKNGYILSQAVVPPQGIKNGTLRITVIEGYISNVRIEQGSNTAVKHPLIESYAEHLKSKRPISLSDLERYLLLIDDLPGATAKGLVRPGAAPGSAELVVTLSHKPWEASYAIDNRGSKFVGPVQHTATLAANSLFGLYDRTLLRFITTSPVKELGFFDIQHEEQLGSEGTRLILTASHTQSEPGDSLKSLNIEGESNFAQAKIVHPFSRSRIENLTGRAAFDVRNSDTDVFGSTALSKDRLRVLRIGGSYDTPDAWRGVNLVDVELAQGLNIFNASDSGNIRSRTDGESDFTKLNLDISRTQAITAHWSVLTAASGQYAFDKLLAAEQFSLGGTGFGRAYDPSELSGDHAAAGKIELRYGDDVGETYLHSYQLYGYYDIGRIWLRGGTNDNSSLSSLGTGIRTNFNEHLSGNLEVALPFTKAANNQGGHDNSPRLFFNVIARY